ncbi:hypothetical protein GYMLUDRAFT_179867 [Collybiopsis luxurians FD-317 M1]|uniref:Uncharacterized protein n=1 Tax=Collybiopsis luxurians FD-317 M1 TaxID=944289 RepID=A0A0D0BDM7_9AGAR|nr:hypothetical protein GYMLUDRAFT_179867 [Collybiopsis luxurians FD-317 M1]
MSDSTGPLSGGTSELLVVGDTLTEASCNTTLLANDFFFSTNDSPSECESYRFTQFSGAVLPVTIFVCIPSSN